MTSLELSQVIRVYGNGHEPKGKGLFQRHISKPLFFSPALKGIAMKFKRSRIVSLQFAQINDCPKISIAAVIRFHFRLISVLHDDISNSRVYSIGSN